MQTRRQRTVATESRVSLACNRIAMLISSRSTDTWNERGLRVLHPSETSSSSSSSCGVGVVASRVSVSSLNTLYRELRCCRGVVGWLFPFPRNGTGDSSDPSYRPGIRERAQTHAHTRPLTRVHARAPCYASSDPNRRAGLIITGNRQ